MIVTFEEFITKLAYGQLKNTALVDDAGVGAINPGHEDQILELTNQGLIDIFTKKKLLEGQAVLTFVDGQNIYTLDTSEGADYEGMVRVLQIDAVKTGYDVIESNKKTFVPKSNKHITQPSSETLRFSDSFKTAYGPSVDVLFQKRHPVIELGDSIDIPAHMYEALVLYVSGLYLSHMGGDQHTAKGDSYYGLYLKMMGDDEINNSSGTSEVVDEDTRFSDRGFV